MVDSSEKSLSLSDESDRILVVSRLVTIMRVNRCVNTI